MTLLECLSQHATLRIWWLEDLDFWCQSMGRHSMGFSVCLGKLAVCFYLHQPVSCWSRRLARNVMRMFALSDEEYAAKFLGDDA